MKNAKGKFIIEPERYEFHAAPIHQFELARRDFFKILGAGIAVFAISKDALARQETAPGHRSFHNEELPNDISAWLHVGEDGSVTGFTGKAEIGQHIRTALAQTIADELRVPFDSVRMVTADTALTPFDAGTFGSRTTPTITPQLRRVAAAARDLLVAAAAHITLQKLNDFRAAGIRIRLQQSYAAHDHSGGAIRALECTRIEKRLLHGIQAAVNLKPLDCRDGLGHSRAGRNLTRAARSPSDQNGAGAALPFAATVLAARQAKLIAQNI